MWQIREAASLPGQRKNILSSLCIYLSATWIKTKTKLWGYSMLNSSHPISFLIPTCYHRMVKRNRLQRQQCGTFVKISSLSMFIGQTWTQIAQGVVFSGTDRVSKLAQASWPQIWCTFISTAEVWELNNTGNGEDFRLVPGFWPSWENSEYLREAQQ